MSFPSKPDDFPVRYVNVYQRVQVRNGDVSYGYMLHVGFLRVSSNGSSSHQAPDTFLEGHWDDFFASPVGFTEPPCTCVINTAITCDRSCLCIISKL